MFRINNDVQRAKTAAEIEALKARKESLEKKHGKKAAETIWKRYQKLVEQMQEQIRQFDTLRREGLAGFKGSSLVDFGNYLIEARIAAGMTQEELARHLGVSQPMVYKYEIKKYQGYSLEVIEKVAKALGVSLDLNAWKKFEQPVYDVRKQENAALYFLNTINNAFLGRTKLMKLLYYLDFEFFQQCGRAVTGDRYVAQPYGPVPEQAEALLAKMEKEGKLHLEKITVREHEQCKYFANIPADLSFFSKDELMHLENVARRFEYWSATQMSNQTHDEYPWQVTRLGDVIDYRLALSLSKRSDFSAE